MTKNKVMNGRKPSIEEAWKQVFSNIRKKYDIISKQHAEAKKKYPELADAYEYLSGYIGFLTNRLRIRELRLLPNDISIPKPPDYPSKGDIICEVAPGSRLCRCARGDFEACDSSGGGIGGPSEEVIEFSTCNDHKKDLTDELARICQIYQQYKDTSDYTQISFNNLRRQVQRITQIQTELMEQGCYEFELLLEYEIKGYVEVSPTFR